MNILYFINLINDDKKPSTNNPGGNGTETRGPIR